MRTSVAQIWLIILLEPGSGAFGGRFYVESGNIFFQEGEIDQAFACYREAIFPQPPLGKES